MTHVKPMATSEPTSAIPRRWNTGRTLLTIMFVVGLGLAWFAQQVVHQTLPDNRAQAATQDDRIDLTLPSPALTPEQVVTLQVDSLRGAVGDNTRLVECYSLAAPSNRLITGPFEVFSDLVRSEPYLDLMLCQDYQVGTAVIEDGAAAVLVSVLTQSNQSTAFRFLLVKQSAVPYEDCWMTEGVFALTPELLSSGVNSSHTLPPAPSSVVSPRQDDGPAQESPFD